MTDSRYLGSTSGADPSCGWPPIFQGTALCIFYLYLFSALKAIRLQFLPPPFDTNPPIFLPYHSQSCQALLTFVFTNLPTESWNLAIEKSSAVATVFFPDRTAAPLTGSRRGHRHGNGFGKKSLLELADYPWHRLPGPEGVRF